VRRPELHLHVVSLLSAKRSAATTPPSSPSRKGAQMLKHRTPAPTFVACVALMGFFAFLGYRVQLYSSAPFADSHLHTPFPAASTNAIWKADVDATLARMEKALVQMQDAIQTNAQTADQNRVALEEIEASLFEDGSGPSNAVLENLVYSPDSRRWVKTCDWLGCRFQALQQSAQYLMSRQANQTRPPNLPAIRVVHLSLQCQSVLGLALAASGFPASSVAARGANCTNPAGPDAVPDKSLDMLVLDGPPNEHTSPYLYRWLRDWAGKLRVGGVAMGWGYKVERPFAVAFASPRQKPRARVTEHEKCTKAAVDSFRLGDDNGLFGDSTVHVAGGDLWYFVRAKATLFVG
jgi:hypothetical protein